MKLQYVESDSSEDGVIAVAGDEDWGSVAEAAATSEDWGSVAAVATESDDWGNV